MSALPKKISEQKLEILKVLMNKKAYILTVDVLKLLPENIRKGANSRFSDMVKIDKFLMVEKVPRGGRAMHAYKLTPLGERVLKNKDKIHITPFRSYSRRKQASPFPLTAPVAAPLNISSTAKNMMNTMAPLIQENADLRNLLVETYNTIGNTLGLNKGDEDNGSSN